MVAIFAGVRGFLDKLPLNKVREFEEKALAEMKATNSDILAEIVKEKKISPELEAKLLKFYEQFTENFVTNLDKAA